MEDHGEQVELVGVEAPHPAAQEPRSMFDIDASDRRRPVSWARRSATSSWLQPRRRRMAARLAATTASTWTRPVTSIPVTGCRRRPALAVTVAPCSPTTPAPPLPTAPG